MTSKYHSILSLYLKHTPHHSKKIVQTNFQKAQIQTRKQNERMFHMMERYINSLQTHREYLEFFQIGVVRDNKKKIENVAKYVGLAIPSPDDHFSGRLNTKSTTNNKKATEQQKEKQNTKTSS